MSTKTSTDNFKMLKALELIAKEEERAKHRTALNRVEKMRKYLENSKMDNGFLGRITEMASHTGNSRKTWVASQNRNDTHFKMEINGRIKYVPAECKINGGRIENLYTSKVKYVIYSMFVHNSLVKTPRELLPILIPKELFLRVLDECNAIKSTNGDRPERAIQATSKALFIRLSDYPIPYNSDMIYTLDDFDDIEI